MAARLRDPAFPVVGGVILAAGAAGLLAGAAPKYAIGATLGLVFLVVALQDVAVGLCVLASLSIIDAQGQIGVVKLAGAVLALSWLATILSRRLRRGTFLANHQVLTYALVVLLGWMALTLLWAEQPSAGVSDLQRYVPDILIIPIAYDALQDRQHVRWVLAVIAISVFVAAVSGILSPPPDPSSADAGRATGTFGDANEFAAALVAGLPLFVAFAARRRTAPLTRVLCVIAALITVTAVFQTLSRGGLVALGATLVASVVFGGRWRRPLLLIAGTLLVAAVGYFALFASLPARERVSNVGGGGTGRLDLWTIGERMVSAHPVRGVGLGNFQVSSVHYLLQPGLIKRTDFIVSNPKVAHNTYLQLASEIGVPGAALFVAIMAFCLWCAVRGAGILARAGDDDLEPLVRGAVVGMCGYVAAIFFISESTSKLLWLLLALGPALLAVSRETSQAP